MRDQASRVVTQILHHPVRGWRPVGPVHIPTKFSVRYSANLNKDKESMTSVAEGDVIDPNRNYEFRLGRFLRMTSPMASFFLTPGLPVLWLNRTICFTATVRRTRLISSQKSSPPRSLHRSTHT
jgi:hypothetical protein